MMFLQQLPGDSAMLSLPRQPSLLCLLAVFAMVVIRSPLAVSQQRPGCRPGTYLNVSTGSCLACTEGVTFLDEEYNTQPRCLDCSVCRGIKIPAVACSAARDTVCRCPSGFTPTIEGHCSPVNAGADVRTPVTDSNGRIISLLTTGSASDGHRSTEAKHSDVEATVLRSIVAKLDQLNDYVISVLVLSVLSMAILYSWIAAQTCCHRKKPRERFPHQTVENQYPTVTAPNLQEYATSSHTDEKDKEQQEKQALTAEFLVDISDLSGGNNSSTLHKRTYRGNSTIENTRSSDA